MKHCYVLPSSFHQSLILLTCHSQSVTHPWYLECWYAWFLLVSDSSFPIFHPSITLVFFRLFAQISLLLSRGCLLLFSDFSLEQTSPTSIAHFKSKQCLPQFSNQTGPWFQISTWLVLQVQPYRPVCKTWSPMKSTKLTCISIYKHLNVTHQGNRFHSTQKVMLLSCV